MTRFKDTKLFNKVGESCYVDESLAVYDFRINDEEQHVIELPNSEHGIILSRFFVCIDCVWDTDTNTLDFVVWNPEHIPLSDFASSDNYINDVTLLTPDHWIYHHRDIFLYDVCGNQAKAHDIHSIGGGTILILDELSFEDCLDLGVLAASGEFDPIISRAVTESNGTLWY